MTGFHGLVTKSVKGKRGDVGRFVTLKTGRVIFIRKGGYPAPHCGRKGAVGGSLPRSACAGPAKKGLSKLVKGMPVKSERLTGSQSGVCPSFVNEYEDGTRVIVKKNETGSAESELMAYEFSEAIGWDIVPETVVPKIGRFADNESVQRWVEDSETAGERLLEGMTEEEYFFEFGEEPMWGDDPKIRMMDLLLQNPDRHLGNIVVDGDDKQWAIDNNLSLTPSLYIAQSSEHLRNWTDANREMFARDQGVIDAAKDIAAWSKTPAYDDYVTKIEKRLGGQVAEAFREGVGILGDWSGTAIAEGEPDYEELEEWLD